MECGTPGQLVVNSISWDESFSVTAQFNLSGTRGKSVGDFADSGKNPRAAAGTVRAATSGTSRRSSLSNQRWKSFFQLAVSRSTGRNFGTRTYPAGRSV